MSNDTFISLEILGRGAVTSQGPGVKALFEADPWPVQTVPWLSAKTDGGPAFRVDLHHEKLEKWQQHPRLRRVSPITLFIMEAANQAMEEAGHPPVGRLGIVSALSSGCIVYTRKFLEGSIKEGRRFASPQLFPETVFNAPASHLASVLGISGPCYSILGDESAWTGAISVAACWLGRGAVDYVLIVGAEELDPISMEAFKASGWLRERSSFIPAEGAAAVVVGLAEQAGKKPRISSLLEGWTYRNRREAGMAAAACFKTMGAGASVYPTATHHWMSSMEKEMTRRFGCVALEEFPYFGQAFPASAGWNMIRAAARLDNGQSSVWLPVWGLNEQISALQLSLP